MHDLVRLYAAQESESTDEPSERRAAEERLLSHYARVAMNALEWENHHPSEASENNFSGRTEAMDWLALEMPNLVAGVQAADALGEYELAKQLAMSSSRYLGNVSDHETAVSVLNIAIAAARKDDDPLAVASCQNNLGIAYTSMRNFREAIRWLNKAVAGFHALGERVEEANALVSLSGALRMHLGVEAGMHPLRAAMEIIGPTNPKAGFVLTNLGISLREAWRLTEAEVVLQQALGIHIRNGAKHAEASTLTHLATTMSQAGRSAESQDYFKRAIASYREVRDLNGEGMAVLNHGNALRGMGALAEARECLEKALQIFRQTRDPHGQGIALGALGMHLADIGEGDKAKPILEDSLRFLDEFHEPLKKRVISEALRKLP